MTETNVVLLRNIAIRDAYANLALLMAWHDKAEESRCREKVAEYERTIEDIREVLAYERGILTPAAPREEEQSV